ncbi:SCO family protein [Vibrio tapetis]|uniref:Sco1-related protein n=1 Tax=Vibrio tapetis subsp. tapetis TaxID=1671868 RepID=A0A2N8ZK32_9VIBR|nr:SCO family protein [Vibrio tapetis]SON52268.1 Sco1-related protein [Vibrio tapetis subsp. tapetis]
MNKNWSLAIVVAFALGVSTKAYLDEQAKVQAETDHKVQQQASSVHPVLTGKDNKSVDIFDANDPRVRVVYFGFTRCADVCPTSLAMLAGALNELDKQQLDYFRPMFISLDPERDGAEDSATYAHYFHPNIEGLSAPLNITKPLADKYGVIFRKTEMKDSVMKYTLDHSSYFYFLKPDGTLITKVPHTLSPAPIVAAMTSIIKEQ